MLPLQFKLKGETLSLKVSNSKVVGVREHMQVLVFLRPNLHIGHQAGTITLNLLISSDGAEHDLDEFDHLRSFETLKSNAPNDFVAFDANDAAMIQIEDKAGNIIFGHVWELTRHHIFEIHENAQVFSEASICHADPL